MQPDSFEDVDYLFGGRERLISETDMSSHIRTCSDDGLTITPQPLSGRAESSYQLYENETLNDELQRSFDDAKLIPDSYSLFDSQEDRMEDSLHENLNIITNLQPISVSKIKSQEETLEADLYEQSAQLSVQACPSIEEYEDSSTRCKHKPKPNSPATLI